MGMKQIFQLYRYMIILHEIRRRTLSMYMGWCTLEFGTQSAHLKCMHHWKLMQTPQITAWIQQNHYA
jgi:hypothetical protein